MRAGRESLLCLQQNKPSRVVYVFFGLTVFCRFLRLYRRYCPQITNFVSLLHATFFSAGSRQAIPSGQDGSMMPSWVANQNTGFVHIAHERCQRYDTERYFKNYNFPQCLS